MALSQSFTRAQHISRISRWLGPHPHHFQRCLSTVNEGQNKPVENRDVVIVGGGPVGLALASALASSSAVRETCTISLLEASDVQKIRNWSPPTGEWSNRVSSVTNENIAFLKRIGGWNHIDESRTNPMERMQVWDGLSSARITFDASDALPSSEPYSGSYTAPSMARFVENLHLQKALLANLEQQGGVELIGGQKVESVQPDAEGGRWPIVQLEGGRRLRARLLIGADGFNSPVKNYSKISSTGWNYDAQCVVGNLELEPSGDNFTAYQRFLTSGPLGLLPLTDTSASLAWSTKPPIATALKALSSEALAAMINASFRLPHDSVSYLLSLLNSASPPTSESLLSEIEWRSSPNVHPPNTLPEEWTVPPRVLSARMKTGASFPLKMFHADRYVGDFGGLEPARTVLVGDAAHVIHPMAGQGLNMGFGDTRVLAQTIEHAIQNGQDIGSPTALAKYPRKQYIHNHAIMSTVDKLHKLYSLDSAPIVWARSIGVEVLQELPSLKAALMGGAGAEEGTASKTGQGIWGGVGTAWEASIRAKEIAGITASAVGALGQSLIGRMVGGGKS